MAFLCLEFRLEPFLTEIFAELFPCDLELCFTEVLFCIPHWVIFPSPKNRIGPDWWCHAIGEGADGRTASENVNEFQDYIRKHQLVKRKIAEHQSLRDLGLGPPQQQQPRPQGSMANTGNVITVVVPPERWQDSSCKFATPSQDRWCWWSYRWVPCRAADPSAIAPRPHAANRTYDAATSATEPAPNGTKPEPNDLKT